MLKGKNAGSLLLLLLIAGCREKTIRFNMLVAVKSSDSAVAFFYHSPGDYRYYDYARVPLPQPLPVISRDVNAAVGEAPDSSCISEGKIYFYGKNGAVETVYFSRRQDCSYFSFIRTGEKYFTRMSGEAKAVLDSLEKKVIRLTRRKE